MKKIDLSAKIKDVRGVESGQYLADPVIDLLATNPQGIKTRKAMGIVSQLVKDMTFECDESDLQEIIRIVDGSQIFNFVKVQILDELEKKDND